MGRYCKAYPLERLRAYPRWHERAGNARPEDPGVTPDSAAPPAPRPLTSDAIVYIQDDYTVTDGIFKDEHVLFDDITPDWTAFCHTTLHFEIPKPDAGEAPNDTSTTTA